MYETCFNLTNINMLLPQLSVRGNTTVTAATNYDARSDAHNMIVGSLSAALTFFGIVVAIGIALFQTAGRTRRRRAETADAHEGIDLDTLERAETGKSYGG